MLAGAGSGSTAEPRYYLSPKYILLSPFFQDHDSFLLKQ